MKKYLLIFLILFYVPSTAFSGLFDPKVKTTVSDFDGFTLFGMSSTGLIGTKQGLRSMDYAWPSLGYSWYKERPNKMSWVLDITDIGEKDYHTVESFNLNIDGKFITVPLAEPKKANVESFGNGVTISTARLEVPLELAKEIIDAKVVKYRIITDKRIFEDRMKGGDFNSKAYDSLSVFLKEIEKK